MNPLNRRDWLRVLGLSGMAAGLGPLSVAEAGTTPPRGRSGEGSGFTSHTVAKNEVLANRANPTVVGGKIVQPQRELPLLHKTDVLVVGGGPAGVAAAVAAKRTGADVTIVDRYGYFGGLWTGGLVLLITGHIVKSGKQTCQGIGEEMMRRLDKLDGGIINRKQGVDPTVDAEAAKYMMVEMIEEAGLKVFLNCWGVDAVMDGNSICGAVFESKAGRQAILAKVVVDCTGDGDLFAAAGAEYDRRTHNVGLVYRFGNIDKIDDSKLTPEEKKKPRRLGGRTPVEGVNWLNMLGPEVDGIDLATLTRLEMEHRRFIWRNLQKNRSKLGHEKLYLVETAPQMGVRITRILNGLKCVNQADMKNGAKLPDVIGVGGGGSLEWPIPYGALVPQKVDQLLAAGRCICTEIAMADRVRLIPNCFVSGHAAGVAAAIAVNDGCKPRDVDVSKLQKILRQQEAYLG